MFSAQCLSLAKLIFKIETDILFNYVPKY
jgi:hypothetical protein